jgi:tellurium resistance protein TerD
MRRGGNVELTREIPNLTGVVLGIDWDVGAEAALSDNLVAAAILCDASGRAASDEHFVFFNQLSSPDLSVQQLAESLGSDEEQIEVDFARVPADVERIVLVLYVNEGPAGHRALGQLRSCVVRVLDPADNRELVRSEELATHWVGETAAALAEVYRHERGWKFKVLGEAYPKGLAGVAADYGLSL